MAKDKARHFTFLLYPESIPESWTERLELLGVPIAISPLHDLDEKETKKLSPEEQNIVQNGGKVYKKAHYHVIYVAKNPVTAESVRIKIKRCLGDKSVGVVKIIVTSIENTYLYLTHRSKDAIAKNKHVYSEKDICLLNNFDIDRYVTLDAEDKDSMLNDICDLIDDHDIANMRELRRFIKIHGNEFGIPSMKVVNSVLRAHTGLIRLYFDAVYQERKYGRTVDNATGEVK